MKRILHKIAAVFLAGALVVGMNTFLFAADQEDSVSLYLPTGDKPVLAFSKGDTFFDFSNIQPGDTLKQEINIENQRSGDVEFFLRVETQSNSDILEKYVLTVKNNTKILYRGDLTGLPNSAIDNRTGDMTKKISLGTTKGKATCTINADIEIPIITDNVIANSFGEIKWILTAEDRSSSGKDKDKDSDGSDSRSSTGTQRLDSDETVRDIDIITEQDIPLSDDLYNIADDQVPLASLPKTGGALHWKTISGSAFALLLLGAFIAHKNRSS